jgi:pSer/pThr/pTyr-binding forkhead associated (FHA) protein
LSAVGERRRDIDIGATVTIGRTNGTRFRSFQDRDISQHHAEVILENGRYVIEDKGPRPAPWNKQPGAGRQVLEDGDVINVGNSTIVFSEQTARTCANCGRSLRAGAKFCVQCGKARIMGQGQRTNLPGFWTGIYSIKSLRYSS